MADYKKIYALLFNAITDAIQILQKAQKSAEEIYISDEDTALTLVVSDKVKTEENDDQT